MPTIIALNIDLPGTASTASSIRSFTRRLLTKMYTHPPTTPVTKAAHGAKVAHPAVMATNPDRAPFIHMVISYSVSPVCILERNISVKRAETDPAAAAMVVVTAARAQTAAEALLEMAKVEPGLNPYLHVGNPKRQNLNSNQENKLSQKTWETYHPTHKMKVPST